MLVECVLDAATAGITDVDMSEIASNISDDAAAVAEIGRGRQPALTGCPWHDVNEMLQSVGLRPTRQRMALGWLLFAKGDRHVSAEMLYEEALRAREPLSLATVYNTLRQFSEAGLLRQVSVSGPKTFFDTNVSEHHHFYNEDDETVVDIPGSTIQVAGLPEAPDGMIISSVEVIVRLRRADGQEIDTKMPLAHLAAHHA